MDREYWQRQSKDNPLFPNLMWSRPEHSSQAGKLLIIGGNAHGFSAAAEAYSEAANADIGTVRVLLPDVLQKTVGKVFKAGEYAPSTPSGSFSKQSLGEVLDLSAWADGVLLAGELGRNSETAILLELFIEKYQGQLTITKDALDYFTKGSSIVLDRENTLLVANLGQLQKLAINSKFTFAFTSSMDFLRFIEALHEFTKIHKVAIMTYHNENIIYSYSGLVSSVKTTEKIDLWQLKRSAQAAVWWLQNPLKTFEAVTSSLIS